MNPADKEKRKENWRQMSAGFNALENGQVSAYAAVVLRHDDPKPYYGFFAGGTLEDARKLLVKVAMIKSFLELYIEKAKKGNFGKELKIPALEDSSEPDVD